MSPDEPLQGAQVTIDTYPRLPHPHLPHPCLPGGSDRSVMDDALNYTVHARFHAPPSSTPRCTRCFPKLHRSAHTYVTLPRLVSSHPSLHTCRPLPAPPSSHSQVRKPIGVVGLVTPWNLPLYLLSWKVAPALAMGNCVVAKPSELTPTTASMLATTLERAGLPPGVFNVVHGTGADAGAALCAHPDVGALSFTGGSSTGAAVAAAVSPRFAKLSLELGGKNPLLVFADADVELAVSRDDDGDTDAQPPHIRAHTRRPSQFTPPLPLSRASQVKGAIRASFLNSGQICLCASRILVQRTPDGFHERFAAAFAAAASALRLGPPTDPSANVGPLVSAAQRDKVRDLYLAAAATDGASTLCGGPSDPRVLAAEALHNGGHWFAPTVPSLDGTQLVLISCQAPLWLPSVEP